ncbi:hypothetical protein SLH49_01520 [Cognatiyoonia sp. IB215446]|uniref:hypothetical protein n=1 Tax=Cognatiyoonia sp. IB215446 TaxID=3097355 RepID=UPI002A134984|nr:hypothetical protein [Cognatiyoonia sp. IB215446]MDX8346651.1 hypothetical protein [Cognatiyoonia sp. IB215446]
MRTLLILLLLWPFVAKAETVPLLSGARQPLFQMAPTSGGVESASLFQGAATGFFAPKSTFDKDALIHIRNVIGQAESPQAGYDAVQHGARIRPANLPTQMTLAEIFAWIDATPGQPHAIGRYQFIPATLRRVATQIDAQPGDRFSPAMQDRLADVLLADAGFAAFLAGELNQKDFMNNLAAIWAGLPTSNGRSRYHGIAGNRATVTLAYFQSEIAKIAPG